MCVYMILDVKMGSGYPDEPPLCTVPPFRLPLSSLMSPPPHLTLLNLSRRLIFFSCAPSCVNAEFGIECIRRPKGGHVKDGLKSDVDHGG